MMSAKRLATGLLRAAMRGDREGLSPFGRLARRFADHVTFHTNELERSWYYYCPPSCPAPGWRIPTGGKIVYDFGANRGSNVAYYLRQGFNVVAVEANPVLARGLSERYEKILQ